MENEIKLNSSPGSDSTAIKDGLANATTAKKISFFSAILIVIGSCVGAGIFFKSATVLDYAGSNLIIAIAFWIIAAIAVICMALALVEVASGRNDNLGLIGWCKEFCGKYVYRSCKYFMVIIYLPLTGFFMPLYVIMSFQDSLSGFGVTNSFGLGKDGQLDWIIWLIISIAICTWFIFAPGLSSKIGNVQNWVITVIKFIPLVIAAILGYVAGAIGGKDGGANWLPDASVDKVTTDWSGISLFKIFPFFGMFGALAGIFFAFDGFYVTAGLQSEMKEPKKTPLALVIGLLIVTVIYLAIAISMSVGSDGSLTAFTDFLKSKNLSWLAGIMNLTVCIGVLGILNGFYMWAPRFVQDLVNYGELQIPRKFLVRVKDTSSTKVGVWFTFIVSLPIIILFTVIGALGYFDASGYAGAYGSSEMDKLYSFADLMGNWTALLAFAFIGYSIFGCIKNRKTNKVKVAKTKYFLGTAWPTVIILVLALGFSAIQPFVDLILSAVKYSSTDWSKPIADGQLSKDDVYTQVIANVCLVVVLFLFIALFFVPSILEEKLAKKRHAKLTAMLTAINNANDIGQIFNSSPDKDKFISILKEKYNFDVFQASAISRLPWKLLKSSNDSGTQIDETVLKKFEDACDVPAINRSLELTDMIVNYSAK